jgi:hypothetical protein
MVYVMDLFHMWKTLALASNMAVFVERAYEEVIKIK